MRFPLANTQVRLFFRSDVDPLWTYAPWIGIWRLMWNGGKQRAIMREPLSNGALLPAVNGQHYDFLLMSGMCSDPSKINEGYILAEINDCTAHRKWLPHVNPSDSLEAARLDYWIEFDCLGGIEMHDIPEPK